MRKNNNTAPNSSRGTRRILELGAALTIVPWLVILISGKRTEENPTTAKETPTAQPEAHKDNRRNLWKKNFPWKPTYDLAVTVTEDMLSDHPEEGLTAVTHHCHLESFFASELRYSPQFEQIYKIMEKHGRTANPVALSNAFSCLQDYYQTLDHDPEEIVLQSNGETVNGKSAIYNGRKGHLAADDLGESEGKATRKELRLRCADIKTGRHNTTKIGLRNSLSP